jgi:hypothetical protein
MQLDEKERIVMRDGRVFDLRQIEQELDRVEICEAKEHALVAANEEASTSDGNSLQVPTFAANTRNQFAIEHLPLDPTMA